VYKAVVNDKGRYRQQCARLRELVLTWPSAKIRGDPDWKSAFLKQVGLGFLDGNRHYRYLSNMANNVPEAD
jgi:hypothetical protein